MSNEKSTVPACIYAVHPGRGQCGLQGMKEQGFVPATSEYVYRCSCGFQWHLTPKEIVALVENSSAEVQPDHRQR